MFKSAAKFPRAPIATVALALVIFCCVFKVTAGDYVVRTLEVDDGLPASTVTAKS
jgi:hypothetical protein